MRHTLKWSLKFKRTVRGLEEEIENANFINTLFIYES